MNLEHRSKNIEQALQIEYEYEKQQFEETISNKSIHDLCKDGVAWYPLQLVETGYTIGEHPFLILEYDTNKLSSHSFRNGSIIKFFQNLDNSIQLNYEKASIYSIRNNKVKIILESNELPSWYNDGKVGIIQDYDEKSMNEMKKALQSVISGKTKSITEFYNIFYQVKPPTLSKVIPFSPLNKTLNPSQTEAISKIIGNNDIEIIHRPPGTGKTTTITEAIFQLCQKGEKILACAPSNAATDLLVEKSASTGLNVLRLGNISRVNDSIIKHTLEYKVENSSEYAEIKKLRKKVVELYSNAKKFKRNFNKEQRDERKEYYREAKELKSHIRWLEEALIDKITSSANVVCTTLVGSSQAKLDKIAFDTVIIDEVSQALEPATWIALHRADKAILAGDPHQLPPTVKSPESEKLGLSTTLLDLGYQLKEKVNLLNTQYRMHPSIMSFSNIVFYENKLKAAENTEDNFFEIKDHIFPSMQFIDTAGCGYEDTLDDTSLSTYNPDECEFLFSRIKNTLNSLKLKYDTFSVGVIAPYRKQVEYMKKYDIENDNLSENYDITISTIDSFQGQEKDIIFISMTRCNNEGNIGFLKDYRRTNVAFTQAKKMLCVIGDSVTLSQDKFYNKWINYCQENGHYISAWELMMG